MSEHYYFAYEVLSVRCSKCLMFTIGGADNWVQFPKWQHDTALLIGAREPKNDEEHGWLNDYAMARVAAVTALDAMAKKVHETMASRAAPEAKTASEPVQLYADSLSRMIPIASYVPKPVYLRGLAAITLSEHQHFDRDWLSVMVDGKEINPPPPTEEPKSWRDQEPML